MKRALPVVLLLLLTGVAIGSAAGLNGAIGAVVAPDPQDLAALSGTQPAVGDEVAATPRPASGRARVKSEREYVNTIMSRNIFDPALIASWNPSATGSGAGAQTITDLKVKLIGTILAEPEIYSAALILDETDSDRGALGYNIGSRLHDAEIIKIEDGLVTLRRGDGRIETLALGDESTVRTSAPPSSGDGESSGDVQQLGENKFAIDRATLDKYIGDIESISKMGRALLHRGPDGEFDGYRLSAIRRNTLADQLGIKNGDVVHAVNGQPLTSVQDAMNAYQGMMNEGNFSFEITRRGQKMTLEYEVR